MRGYGKLGQSNHWHARDLWLRTDPVGELRRYPNWVGVLTGECGARVGATFWSG